MSEPASPLVLVQNGRAWAWAAVEVTAAHDLARRTDFARLDRAQRLAAAVGEQADYVQRLLAVGPSAVVALRWLWQPAERRLRLWLIGRVTAADPAQAVGAVAGLANRLLDAPPHVSVAPVAGQAEVQAILQPFVPGPRGLAQVTKRVRVHETVRADAGVRAYLAVEPFAQQPTDWTPLLEAIGGYPHPLSLTVALSPQPVPAPLRRTLEREATRYAHLSQPFEAPLETGGRVRHAPDSTAANLEPVFRDALNRYADRAFRYAVTLASPHPLDPLIVESVGNVLAPPAATAGRHDTSAVPAGYAVLWPAQEAGLRNDLAALEPNTLPEAEFQARLAADPTPERHALAHLRALVDSVEARSLLRFPVALDGRVPRFPVVAPPDGSRHVESVAGAALLLGHQGGAGTGGDPVHVAVRALPRHGFIVGTPGSGKTNTALHLCRQLWRDHQVPFMVLEPVNAGLDDYRWLATQPGFEDLLVFTVGDESVAPLRLNPFQVPAGVAVVAHISNLLACFEAAFGLWDPLPFIYRRALTRAYRARGWHAEDRGSPDRVGRWPVLGDFVSALGEVIDALGYAGELGSNIRAAGLLRAQALGEGACGPTLDCRASMDIGALVRRPVVVELAGVGDNAKEQALVTLLLLNAVRGYRRGAQTRADDPHVLLIEEAHRIFPRARPGGGGDVKEGNAQELAAERIAQGLAEDRKYGQAYLLVDQQVGKVAEDAYKITDLKVMHRTAAEEDRRLLGSTMSMHPDQIEAAAALGPFEAVVSRTGLDRAVTVRVPDVRAADARARGRDEAPLADDEQLRQRYRTALADLPQLATALAPYEECVDCRHPCQFRRQAESLAAGPQWTLTERVLHTVTPPDHGGTGYYDPAALADFRACVLIHTLRRRYPPQQRDDLARARILGLVAQARQALRDGTDPGGGR